MTNVCIIIYRSGLSLLSLISFPTTTKPNIDIYRKYIDRPAEDLNINMYSYMSTYQDKEINSKTSFFICSAGKCIKIPAQTTKKALNGLEFSKTFHYIRGCFGIRMFVNVVECFRTECSIMIWVILECSRIFYEVFESCGKLSNSLK